MSLFRQLADASPVLLWTIRDDDGTCIYLNDAWHAFTGLDLAAAPAQGWWHIVYDADRATAEQLLHEPLGHHVEATLRLRRADGAYRWFKVVARRIVTDDGVVWHGTNVDINELKVAEAVTATDEPYLELVRAQRVARTGSWSYDLRRNTVRWSAELFRIFRLPSAAAAVPYDEQAHLFSPSSWQALRAAVDKAARDGTGYTLTLEIVRADGERGIAEARAEATVDDDGVALLVGTLQDVTEREQTAAALRATTERLTLARAAAGFGIWEWNTTTQGLAWDDGMYALYGVPPDSVRAADAWQAALHPDDAQRVNDELARGLAMASSFELHYRITRADGAVRHIRAFALVVADGGGRVIGVNQDVTEQRVAELQLRQSEAMQRAVLTHAGPVIVATDVDGTITLWNRAAEDMLGYRAEDVVGIASPLILHVDSELEQRRVFVEEMLQAEMSRPFDVFVAMALVNEIDAREWTYVRRDGSRLPVLLTTTVLRDDDGNVIGFLSVAVDLTQRRAAESHLMELNRLLQERSRQREVLLQEVHHRVKNNLQVIASLMNLQLRKLDEPTARAALTECRSRVQSIALIHEQLYTSRDYGRVPFAEYAAQLSRNIVAAGADAARIALVLRLDPLTLGVDKAIPAGLILNELLTNALKHAFPDGRRGTLTVELTAKGGHVVLVVADDGVGNGSVTPQASARSLGLHLVDTLVRQLDGGLSVVGVVGTRYTVTFPEGAA